MYFHVIGFVFLVLLTVSQEYSWLSAEEDHPKNVILVFGRMPRKKKDMERFFVSSDTEVENKAMYFNFPSKGVMKGCLEDKKRSVLSVYSMLGYFPRRDDNTNKYCEETLERSITSLISWASNDKQKSSVVLNINLCETTNEYERQSQAVPLSEKQNLMDGSRGESDFTEFQKPSGIVRRILDKIDFGATGGDTKSMLHPLITPSIENLRTVLINKILTERQRFLVVIKGGELQDPLDPKKSSGAQLLDEALSDAMKLCDSKNTLVIVTGQCPDGGDGNTEVPIYAAGPGSKYIVETKFLWNVPLNIQELLEYAEKQHDQQENFFNSLRKSPKMEKIFKFPKKEEFSDTSNVKELLAYFKYLIEQPDHFQAPNELAEVIPLRQLSQKKEDESKPIELKDIDSEIKNVIENPYNFKKTAKKRRSLDNKMKFMKDVLKGYRARDENSSLLISKLQASPSHIKKVGRSVKREIRDKEDIYSTGNNVTNKSNAMQNHKNLNSNTNKSITREFGNVSDRNTNKLKSERTLKLSDKESGKPAKDFETFNDSNEPNIKHTGATRIVKEVSENNLDSGRTKINNDDSTEMLYPTAVIPPSDFGESFVNRTPDSLIKESLPKLVQMVENRANKTRREKEFAFSAENAEIEKLLSETSTNTDSNPTNTQFQNNQSLTSGDVTMSLTKKNDINKPTPTRPFTAGLEKNESKQSFDDDVNHKQLNSKDSSLEGNQGNVLATNLTSISNGSSLNNTEKKFNVSQPILGKNIIKILLDDQDGKDADVMLEDLTDVSLQRLDDKKTTSSAMYHTMSVSPIILATILSIYKIYIV